MKLVTFVEPYYRSERLGLWIENKIIDLNYAYGRMLKDQGDDYPEGFADAYTPSNMTSFLQGGSKCMSAARETENFVKSTKNLQGPNEEKAAFDISQVRLKAPIPRPGKSN